MQERLSTYRGVRIDDTAEWRLVIHISDCGMSAYLKNLENPLEQLITLFDEEWPRDEKSLLSHIEQMVYDHPQIMDDFSTEIVICTPRTVWAPAEICMDEDLSVASFRRVFDVDDEDVMVDVGARVGVMYSLVPGLSAFLRRTLSGVRISSHQNVMFRRFSSRGGELPCLFVNIRKGEADYILLDDRKLQLAVTHPWHDPMDIAYTVFNIMDVYSLPKDATQVSLSGEREPKQFLLKQLREQVAYVMLTMVPTAVADQEIPLAAAFALTK